jgi:hypothetical protein
MFGYVADRKNFFFFLNQFFSAAGDFKFHSQTMGPVKNGVFYFAQDLSNQ